jgi:hypothetical protein
VYKYNEFNLETAKVLSNGCQAQSGIFADISTAACYANCYDADIEELRDFY